MPVTHNDVREFALTLPRSYEAVVRQRMRFRVGQIVYVAFSHNAETMGFGFVARRERPVRAAQVLAASCRALR